MIIKSRITSFVMLLLAVSSTIFTAKANDMPAVIVEPYTLAQSDFYEKFEAVGQVKYSKSQYGIAKQAGTLEYVTGVQGGQVAKDDVIILLNSVKAMQAVTKAESELRFAQDSMHRDESLFAKKIVSQEVLQESRVAVERSMLEVVKTKRDLEDLVIKAPFDGIIDVIKARVGDEIKLGDKLFTIIAPGKSEVIVELPQILDQKLDEQTKIYTIDAQNNIAIGNLIAMSSSLSSSGTLATKVEFDENSKFVHDSYIKVMFEYNRHKGLAIPEKAVMKNDTGNFVYKIADDSKVKQIYITTGIRTDGNIEILSDNITLGDKIVLEGLTKVYDGSEVQLTSNGEK